jgi:hypothetical protein
MRVHGDGTTSLDRARHAADQRNSDGSKQLAEVRIAKDAKVEKKSKKNLNKKKLTEAKVRRLRRCRLEGTFEQQQEENKLIGVTHAHAAAVSFFIAQNKLKALQEQLAREQAWHKK